MNVQLLHISPHLPRKKDKKVWHAPHSPPQNNEHIAGKLGCDIAEIVDLLGGSSVQIAIW
jgi:hypothetical protein